MTDPADADRGPIMISDPEVLKAARHIRGQLAGARSSVEGLRRRVPAADPDQLEDAADVLAWVESMVDALETGPENFAGLAAEEINSGWRIVRDGTGAELKFLLEALGEGTGTPWVHAHRGSSPHFNLLVMARRNHEELWDRPEVRVLDGLVAPAARASLAPFLAKAPTRARYLEMSRALQSALSKAVRAPGATDWPAVRPYSSPQPEGERLFGKGDRVYHRRRDLFGQVLEVWLALPGDSEDAPDIAVVVKFEPPWDQALAPEKLPAGEFVPASSMRGN